MDAPDFSSGRFEEATIAGIHRSMRDGDLTARKLTRWYLDRVERLDDRLGAYLRTAPNALDRAAALDERFAEGGLVGPLHGVPVAVKDNVDTGDMETTAGSHALAGCIPPDDATIVRRLREAGAIVIGKANLDEFARDWHGFSPLGGQIHNPYDVDRIPGGSSGGTAAALAANFATVGIGTDTGGSVRIPAAFTNLVGLRPTTGLVSRDGIVPISRTHDTAGPLARTVADAAAMLDALAGYDPADPATARSHGRWPGATGGSYRDCLQADSLDGARIGLLAEMVEAADPSVAAVVETAADDMERGGATVERTTIPDTDLRDFWGDLTVVDFESKRDFDAYLSSLDCADAPGTLTELIESGDHREDYGPELRECAAVDVEALPTNTEYLRRQTGLADLRDRVMEALAAADLDALLYPAVAVPPVPIGDEVPVAALNTTLAAAVGIPALAVPAGFTDGGLPVGLEFAGRPFDEAGVLGLGYAYEQATGHRRPPAGF